jgi:hypothetical protein
MAYLKGRCDVMQSVLALGLGPDYLHGIKIKRAKAEVVRQMLCLLADDVRQRFANRPNRSEHG